MRLPRVASASLALALGVCLLLLAQDVRSWHRTLGDATLAASRGKVEQPRTTAGTVLPATLSASLLGVGRDRQWLKALWRFHVAYDATIHEHLLTEHDYRLLNSGQAALAALAQDPNPVRASRAYNLLAVLVFREAYPGTVVVRRLVQESLTNEQNAVRLDPANEPAKQNLELTLRVLVAVDLAPQQARAAGTRRANARKGGFEGPPGAGY